MRSLPPSTILGIASVLGAALTLIGCGMVVLAGIAPARDVAAVVALALGGLGKGLAAIVLPERAAPLPPVTAADALPAGGRAGAAPGDHP